MEGEYYINLVCFVCLIGVEGMWRSSVVVRRAQDIEVDMIGVGMGIVVVAFAVVVAGVEMIALEGTVTVSGEIVVVEIELEVMR